MKIRSLFLLIVFFITIHNSFCQINEEIEYHIVKKTYSKEHNGFELAKNQFLTSKFSKDFFYINLTLKNLSVEESLTKILAQHDVDISMADETYLFYENNNANDMIFLWKLDDEYYSKIYFYYFTENRMRYLGEVTIGENCIKDGCEAFNVPKENIHVSKFNDFVSVLFKGEHVFFSKEIIPKGSLRSDNPTFDFSLNN